MPTNLGKFILVVEDNRASVQIVRSLLSRIGFKDIDDAPNGLEALVKMSEKNYDLVLADWNMQPVSGYELLKFIRSDSAFARTKVIMMTAAHRADHVIAAKKAGANNFIGKPFNAETLKAKIDSSLSSQCERRVPWAKHLRRLPLDQMPVRQLEIRNRPPDSKSGANVDMA